MNRPVLGVLLSMLLAGCGGASASQPAASGSPSAPPQSIKIAHSSTGATMMPIQIAQASGAYAANGLSVEPILGPNGITALIAGDVQAAVTSTEDIISADLGGADLIIVGVMLPYIGQDVIARPEIKSMADLKG